MIFTVTWIPSAHGELTNHWIKALDRDAVSDAANRIDAILRNDPHLQGQPYRGRRMLIEPPLAVTFSVYPEDRLVEVLQVERTPPTNGRHSRR